MENSNFKFDETKFGVEMEIPLGLIDADPGQPRKNKPLEHIEQLGRDIEFNGQKYAVDVRKNPDADGRFLLVNGECRYLAHKNNEMLARKGTILAKVRNYVGKNPHEIYVEQIADNENRLNLGTLESIQAYGTAVSMGASVYELSRATGKNGKTIEADLQILRLPKDMLEMVDTGKMPKVIAREIASFETDHQMVKAWEWARNAKGAKNMQAKIDAYRAEIGQKKVDELWIPTAKEKKAMPDEVKKAGEFFDKLQKTIVDFKNSPYANGKGGFMLTARRKKLDIIEDVAQSMIKEGEKILGLTRAYRARDKHAVVS